MATNFTFIKGNSPLVITAIHDGHKVRNELKSLFALGDAARLREEDPFTAFWTDFSDNRIIVNHSRFEADVNRPREKAVYQIPEDAWGLEVWKDKLPQDVLERSLKLYDDFYKAATSYFDELFAQNRVQIVYDIHSYNYRRDGIDSEADPMENPEINLGTQNMDREVWHPVVDTLLHSFRNFNYAGRNLDVRENVKFKGGYFGKWLLERYGKAICPISIEVKKIFMDEHSGRGFEKDINLISALIESSIAPVLKALNEIETNLA
ncbi:N-formylglutamate amidohydrolase [Algoriphagus sp. A40]|uniref:N-formylglutamate amidohydrolase n=1 Tax=Algoriphagus sp. A40 TaxID=1945863 RepID=UPI00098766E3|nr:N-formylglutamate amidohydrolase [Algoriphagus sp. A40]OOG71906.1 N-formylglutamate amidohydrolase [Algoriphagus sp. A40]